jgi:nucleoside-diphosphate-sugar epimerase
MSLNRSLPYQNVAVIGGAGYVGSALVPYLAGLGYEVTVIDLFLFGEDVFNGMQHSRSLRRVKGDIRDAALLKRELRGIDAVIHLACISNDPSFELDPKLGKAINYDAFIGLLTAVRENGVKRFIYASSSSVYGVKSEPNVREDNTCEPLTDYSKYKLLCEQVLKSTDLGSCEYVILRPATVCGYAPRMRLDLTVNILTISALARKEIRVYGGSQLRPNINIKDMIEAYRILLEAPKEKIHGEIFNAGYENLSVAKLAGLVQQEVRDPEVVITVEPTYDQRSYHINSDKIRRALGFEPCHTVGEAVQSICDAYRKGCIPNPLTDPRYYNINTLQAVKLQ